MLTNRALFKFNKLSQRFSLLSLNHNNTIDDIIKLTGFDFDIDNNISEIVNPDINRLEILRDIIAPMVAEFYPEFAKKIWNV